jgi:hypothetical protein
MMLSGRWGLQENIPSGVARPISVLTCYFKRRRIGAYLDGTLPAELHEFIRSSGAELTSGLPHPASGHAS